MYIAGTTLRIIIKADVLGSGSTQATTDPSSAGNDDPFWNALNANVENLHAVISGHGTLLIIWTSVKSAEPNENLRADTVLLPDHGNEWCIREPTKNVIFCFDKHSG